MLALCLMLLVTYYALNYGGIIGQGLVVILVNDLPIKFSRYLMTKSTTLRLPGKVYLEKRASTYPIRMCEQMMDKLYSSV